MPDFSKLHFKVVHERRSTEPQPFNLLTEERGQVFEEYREQWKQQWEEIEKIQREFIANPAPPPPRVSSRKERFVHLCDMAMFCVLCSVFCPAPSPLRREDMVSAYCTIFADSHAVPVPVPDPVMLCESSQAAQA